MKPSDTITLMAFVPARDFELSRRFYPDLGFDLAFSGSGLARLQIGETAFMLQDFYVEALARNLMLHLQVADVDAWHRHVRASDLAARYGVAVGEITQQPWRQRDFAVHDPSGVLWRIAQNT
jgi:catechol 2,3-dioxygenase-like lactoylglutathione lyase family enzyme